MAKRSQINSITELYNTNEEFKEIILKYIIEQLQKENIIPSVS